MRGLFLAVVSLCLTACISDSDGNDAVNLGFTASSGLQTGIDNQQIRVLRNAADYAALMSQITVTGTAPNPDFSSKMLIAVLSTLDSCYTLSAKSVVKSGDFVTATVGVAGPAAVCPAVVGRDYLFIEVDQTPGQVSVRHEAQ